MDILYHIRDFPFATNINPSLYNTVKKNLISTVNSGRDGYKSGGKRTHFNLHESDDKEIAVLTTWINNLLPDVSRRFAFRDNEQKYECLYDINRFKIVSCWGIHYDRGQTVLPHNHFPFTLSFIYYVSLPKGSSPLKIENRTIKVKEGQCIFFLPHYYHGIKPNKSDGRCAIVGNILYAPPI